MKFNLPYLFLSTPFTGHKIAGGFLLVSKFLLIINFGNNNIYVGTTGTIQ